MRLLRALAVGLMLAGPLAAQDYDKGLAAYEAGDYATALQEFRPLAEQGDARAQSNLGEMYLAMKGVPLDWDESLKWLRLAAEQGYSEGQYELGVALYNGFAFDVPEDYVAAAKWFRLAAEQGHVSAQFRLSNMYERGEGVPQDYVAAAKWIRLVAEQGHQAAQKAAAQKNLGIMYFLGQGVPQDYVAAHMWLNISAAYGDQDGVLFRDLLERDEMNPDQISEAQRRASVCMASNYQDCY